MKDLERWKAEMPKEEEMRPKDKYTIFDRKEKRYRKGIHSELIFLESLGVTPCDSFKLGRKIYERLLSTRILL